MLLTKRRATTANSPTRYYALCVVTPVSTSLPRSVTSPCASKAHIPEISSYLDAPPTHDRNFLRNLKWALRFVYLIEVMACAFAVALRAWSLS